MRYSRVCNIRAAEKLLCNAFAITCTWKKEEYFSYEKVHQTGIWLRLFVKVSPERRRVTSKVQIIKIMFFFFFFNLNTIVKNSMFVHVTGWHDGTFCFLPRPQTDRTDSMLYYDCCLTIDLWYYWCTTTIADYNIEHAALQEGNRLRLRRICVEKRGAGFGLHLYAPSSVQILTLLLADNYYIIASRQNDYIMYVLRCWHMYLITCDDAENVQKRSLDLPQPFLETRCSLLTNFTFLLYSSAHRLNCLSAHAGPSAHWGSCSCIHNYCHWRFTDSPEIRSVTACAFHVRV